MHVCAASMHRCPWLRCRLDQSEHALRMQYLVTLQVNKEVIGTAMCGVHAAPRLRTHSTWLAMYLLGTPPAGMVVVYACGMAVLRLHSCTVSPLSKKHLTLRNFSSRFESSRLSTVPCTAVAQHGSSMYDCSCIPVGRGSVRRCARHTCFVLWFSSTRFQHGYTKYARVDDAQK